MRETPPTTSESAFFNRLSASVPDAQDWYHVDDDGTPWMTASFDDMVDGVMATTWRVDFDGLELVGGQSPSNLNWDDGVRGRATGMNLAAPDGLVAKVSSAEQAAHVAADWFDRVTQGRASA
ncbi:hypothetical protein [Nocardioides sp. 616]|uniref:hypothetical protein n=1 Tax=Nocardioides sp. 616 TaxID=2268090 RepID=UPI000CE43A8C|nr:hypothetical protein [Nocardioides sp. 616]